MTSCRTETETVSRMEKAEPFDVRVGAAASRWRRRLRLPACVRHHRRNFEHILWCFHVNVNVNVNLYSASSQKRL